MEKIDHILNNINSIVWGPMMLTLILGTGFYLMLGLKLMPLRKIIPSFRLLWRGRVVKGEGDISAFSALMTSLSATIGTGNIAGVATAIFLGGPGALFWMWCTALVGMATKYAEAVCAVHYRETDENGLHIGGPMYYIKNGLGKQWRWLAVAFSLCGMIAGFGIGNMVQSNSVANVVKSNFQIEPWLTSIILTFFVGLVLIGGIKRIAQVASRLVPLMGFAYLFTGIIVLSLYAEAIPSAFSLILTSAFTPVAAQGGFAGAAVWAAIRFGVARGVFSNEAGLGSAPIAHAAAATEHPVKQGMIAMLGTFIDTIILCTITGLIIIVTGAWTSGENGASLSTAAFSIALPGFGNYIVAIGLILFAFTTIIGWSYYGEKCAQYLLGVKCITPFRILWVCAVAIGPLTQLETVWLLADTLNAMMALPNLIALLLLSPVIFKITKHYLDNDKT